MEKKIDRRVKYTKMVLKQSLIKLLGKKNISQITIKEICEDADINRATFYAHYSDQYDLLQKIEGELLKDISSYLAEHTQNKAEMVDMMERIFDYIKENAALCRLLLIERGDLDFQRHVMMLVYDNYINEFTCGGSISKEDAEYIYSFTIIGSIGAIQKWIDDGMQKSTRYMAQMLLALTDGMKQALGSHSEWKKTR